MLTGVILMKKLIFSKNDITLLKRVLVYVKPNKFKFLVSFVTMLLSALCGIIQPLIWGKFLTILFQKRFQLVKEYLIYIVLLFVAEALISFYRNYLLSSLGQSIIYEIKNQMYKKILDLPIKAFDEIGMGEFLSRLNGDAGNLANILTNQVMETVLDVIKVIFITVAMFRINYILAIIVLTTFPLFYLVFMLIGKKIRHENDQVSKINDQYFRKTGESVHGIREIKSMGIKQIAFDSFMQLGKSIKEKTISMQQMYNLSQVLSRSIWFISNCLVIAVSVSFMMQGMLSMDYFITFKSYSDQTSFSLINISRLNSNIQQLMTSLERIFGLMDNLSYPAETFGTKAIDSSAGSIEFNNVDFEYHDNIPILKKVSFRIEENRKVAFVGSSGSGKTTIFNLLLRFYEPLSGRIIIGDINISEYSEASLRSHISVVRQEPILFKGTIKENLLLANPHASDEEICQACKKADIHNFIMSQNKQYEEMIEENSVNFSGGQKQRLAIARALLKGSKIILFDEATAALDNESQFHIKNVIDELSKDHTVIIIAHRLMTIIEADEIYVFEDGEILGKGKHEDLIVSNVKYQNLYKKELDLLNSKSQEAS